MGCWHLRTSGSGDALAIHEARSGEGPGKGVLAETGWGDRGWVHRQFQMLKDLPDHLALRDGGNDPQCPLLLTPRVASGP